MEFRDNKEFFETYYYVVSQFEKSGEFEVVKSLKDAHSGMPGEMFPQILKSLEEIRDMQLCDDLQVNDLITKMIKALREMFEELRNMQERNRKEFIKKQLENRERNLEEEDKN